MLLLLVLACGPEYPSRPGAVPAGDLPDVPDDPGSEQAPALAELDADDASARLDPIELLDLQGPGDLDGDGLAEVLVSTRTWDAGGAVLLFRGGLPADAHDADADLVVTGAPGQQIGQHLAAGDLDGDGVGDVLFVDWPASSIEDARVHLLSGALVGEVTPSDGLRIEAGIGDLAVGDVDGDGQADVLSAQPRWVADGAAAYVFYGPVATDRAAESADHVVLGSDVAPGAGYGALLADVDSDGADDVIVGDCDAQHGRAWILRAPGSRELSLEGGEVLSGFGCAGGVAVERAGDLDGDGHSDLAIADLGGVFVVSGPITSDRPLWDAPVALWWEDYDGWDFQKSSVAGVGDVDGDGFLDLAAGAVPQGREEGAGWIAYGPFEGTRELRAAADVRAIAGDGLFHHFGTFTEPGGDLDGDALPDVLFGAWARWGGERGGGAYAFGGRR